MASGQLFLSPSQLIELTGAKTHSGQIRKLRENRIPFLEMNGKPKVLLSVIESLAGVTVQGSETEPDWSALDGSHQNQEQTSPAGRLLQ